MGRGWQVSSDGTAFRRGQGSCKLGFPEKLLSAP